MTLLCYIFINILILNKNCFINTDVPYFAFNFRMFIRIRKRELFKRRAFLLENLKGIFAPHDKRLTWFEWCWYLRHASTEEICPNIEKHISLT